MASLWGRRTLVTTVCVASAWALIGCATPNQAPVEDHSAKPARTTVTVAALNSPELVIEITVTACIPD